MATVHHQSSLGNLFVIMPTKLYPLWYSPLLPLFFFLSAIAVGLAMVIFVNEMGERAFGRAVAIGLLQRVSKFMALVLAIFLVLRLWDLGVRGSLRAAFVLSGPGSLEANLFWLEAGLFVLPMVLVLLPSRRDQPQALFSSSVMVIGGFLASRLNVSTNALEASAGVRYCPSWMEGAITLTIVALCSILFAIASRYMPTFLQERVRSAVHA